MIRDLTIEGFRRFDHFRIGGLSRVNILVGANNAGKTAALEAIELLHRGPSRVALANILGRREEYLVEETYREKKGFPYDVRGLYHGRKAEPGSRFSISGRGDRQRDYACTLQLSKQEQMSLFGEDEPAGRIPAWDEDNVLADPWMPVELVVETDSGDTVLPLHANFYSYVRGTSGYSVAEKVRAALGSSFALPSRPNGLTGAGPERAGARYLGTETFDAHGMARLWDKIVLTSLEEQVIEALRIVEPGVERLATLGATAGRPGFYVQLRDTPGRVPIGSLGEGVKRLLMLALAIGTTPAGGVLLVDEVDTGLHFRTLGRVWRLLIESASRFDFQVFATTHSLDFLHSLGEVLPELPEDRKDLSVHRLEVGRHETVRFAAEEFEVVLSHELEIR